MSATLGLFVSGSHVIGEPYVVLVLPESAAQIAAMPVSSHVCSYHIKGGKVATALTEYDRVSSGLAKGLGTIALHIATEDWSLGMAMIERNSASRPCKCEVM